MVWLGVFVSNMNSEVFISICLQIKHEYWKYQPFNFESYTNLIQQDQTHKSVILLTNSLHIDHTASEMSDVHHFSHIFCW